MEKVMNTFTKILLAAALLSLPATAFAQSSDAAYCNALVAKYQQYLDQSSKKGQQPQSVDAQAAVEKCKAGDTSGIPAIEKALMDASSTCRRAASSARRAGARIKGRRRGMQRPNRGRWSSAAQARRPSPIPSIRRSRRCPEFRRKS
jgi:hypothetical protein